MLLGACWEQGQVEDGSAYSHARLLALVYGFMANGDGLHRLQAPDDVLHSRPGLRTKQMVPNGRSRMVCTVSLG